MARQSDLHRHLTAAAAAVRRERVLEWLADLPQETAIGTIIDTLASSDFAEAFRALQVEDLGPMTAETATTSQPGVIEETVKPERARINTRTRGGRLALDTAVRDDLVANGPSSIAGISSRVPGNEVQVRQSIRRLIEGNEVVGRETEVEALYFVTSAVAARAGANATMPEISS